MFDVVVIGGNLSGATASINASKMGVNVALIEKNKEPYFPPRCGEGTDGVTVELLDLKNIGCKINEIRKFTINVASDKEYIFKVKKNKLFIIDRYFIEKKLLKNAKEQGVNVIVGKRMKQFNPPNDIILENGDIIKGKVIIDATGINCQIGKQIGLNTELLPKHIGVCIQSRVEGNFQVDNMKMWFHKPYAPFGYAWLFPKNDKLANIGIGLSGGQKLDLKKLHDKYLSGVVKDKYKILHTFRSCVPASKTLEPLSKGNVMFVGDAARLVNPIFENGINNAIFSGTIAGLIAANYLQGKISSLSHYEQLLGKKIKRINKAYKLKNKLTTDKKFTKAYRRGISLLYILNRVAPNLVQKQLVNIVLKDKKIIDSLKNN